VNVGKFEPGNTFGTGRPRGSRNRLSNAFVLDLHAEWERSGPAALKLMAMERPHEFCKLVGMLLPKELQLEQSHVVSDLSDEDLGALIEHARQQILERRAPAMIEDKARDRRKRKE